MVVLRLTDAATRLALQHPLIKNKTRIGRGAFCIVFDNAHSVLKLTCDQFQYQFYTHGERPRGEYFPRLIQDFGIVGGTDSKPLYLVEMEKLTPLRSRSATPRNAWEQRRSFLSCMDAHRARVWMNFNCANAEPKILIACLRGLREYDCVDTELRVAASGLADFCELITCSPDLHRSNFMLRDSQLVLNDVVKDQHEVYRRTLLRYMPPDAVEAYLERVARETQVASPGGA